MPDARLTRIRATLPTGYQFGDASLNARMGHPFGPTLTAESRAQLQSWQLIRQALAESPFPNFDKAYAEYRAWDGKQPPVSEWPGFTFEPTQLEPMSESVTRG